MESNARFYRRRATEELAAAQRAVTPAARERRIQLAQMFLRRLDEGDAQDLLFDWGVADRRTARRKAVEHATHA